VEAGRRSYGGALLNPFQIIAGQLYIRGRSILF
jgi:hypothetical protein